MDTVTPYDLRERKRRHARVWVRSTTLIISTASLIVAILAIIQYAWYFNAIMSIAVFAAAVTWEIADLITYCVNKRGIHPGAHVGLELVFWLAMVVCTVFWGITGAWWDSYNYDYYSDTYTYNQPGIAIAAVVTESLSTIFHFTLFVWACVDTDRRRKMRYAEMAAMVNQNRMSMAATTMTGNTPYNYPPPPPGMVYQLVAAPLQTAQQPQPYAAPGGVVQNTRYSQAPPQQGFQQYDQASSNGSPQLQHRVQSFHSTQTPTQPPQAYTRQGQQYVPRTYSNVSEIDHGIPTPLVIEMSAKRD